MKKNRIELTTEQRKEIEKFSKTGVHSARLIQRAKIILLLDASDGRKSAKFEEIAHQLGTSTQTVYNTKKDFRAAESVSTFLERKKRLTPPVEPKLNGELEAHIVALACGKPPEGYERWTLKLLADKVVKLQYVDSLSYVSVSRVLKKRNLSLT